MTTKSGAGGRPATFSRDDAIERAMQLFWREGYLGVTARDLAQAMQIQRSSFYNSFAGKEAVFEEAVQRYLGLAPDRRLDEIEAGQPVLPVLVAALRELCRVRAADPEARGCLVCNCVAELVGVDARLGARLDAVVTRRRDVTRRLFAQAVEQGEFTPRVAVADLAPAFVSMLLGLNLASKVFRDEDELWSICRTFLLGIGVDAPDLEIDWRRDESPQPIRCSFIRDPDG